MSKDLTAGETSGLTLWAAAILALWKIISNCKIRGKDWKGMCCLVEPVLLLLRNSTENCIWSRTESGCHCVGIRSCWLSLFHNSLWIDCENPKGFLCHSGWNKIFSLLKINYWVFCCFIIYLCALGNLSLLEPRKHHLKHISGKRSAQLCFVIPFLQVVQEVRHRQC